MIRAANINDIGDILDLLSQVLSIHHNGRPDIFKANVRKYSENELKELLNDEKRPIFVYENATRVVGYAFCIIKEVQNDNILCDKKTLYIDDLCVDESRRGGGIGRALYEYVCHYAKDIGCYNITLNVWECNQSAKHFYEELGLLPQKTVMEKIL